MAYETATSTVTAPDSQPLEASPKRPVRVAWVAGQGTLADLAPALQPLAISLMDELVELHVFAPESADARALPSPPLETVRYGRSRRRIFAPPGVEEIASKITSLRIPLVHALDVGAAGVVRRVSARTGCRYVVSSYALGDARRLGRLGRRVGAILAASEPVQRDLMESRALSAERIYLVRPGVVRVSRPTCFSRPENAPAIVVGGRLADFECFEAVLATFADLKARGHACAYFIIGQGRAESRLRARAESLGLVGDVTFVERQPLWQMTGILKSADIYISPAPAQELDFQSLLAMAAGVPVLSVGNPASAFLKDGRTTSQFRQSDASELTMRLLSLLDDRAAAKGLAENALEYLGRYHGPQDMSAKTAEIYRRVIAEAAAEKKEKSKA